MAHFAKIENNIATNVIVINNDVCGDTFPDSEPVGQEFIANTLRFNGEWKQTSYNGNFRGVYAYPGFTYDSTNDIFVPPQPYPSWTLDENNNWQPPTPYPLDASKIKRYAWNEEQLLWVESTGELHE